MSEPNIIHRKLGGGIKSPLSEGFIYHFARLRRHQNPGSDRHGKGNHSFGGGKK
ncbi:hypothetical protein [Pelotalea chapellei]|uniref:Uncharacterized protein n=1 Tax=Pelotalea chapellei TaxID=44671 RepID=A0ABS5U3S6_9BACT|nr:hypothetical protein [Pelotalea chapellei]MBT1070321.1 hypothetical protein [Pelotalea chapellei]